MSGPTGASVRTPVICALLLLAALEAAELAGQSYLSRTFSEDNGLPSSTVRDAAADADGRLWLATRGGVAVWDGSEWRSYTTRDGLPEAHVSDLEIDAAGTVWALGASAAAVWVARARNDRFSALPAPPFAGLGAATSLAVTRGRRDVAVAVGSHHDGLLIWRQGDWHRPDDWPAEARPPGPVEVAAHNGWFYAATPDGLLEIDATAPRLLTLPATDAVEPVYGVAVEAQPAGTGSGPPHLWLAGDGWVGRRTAAGLERFAAPPQPGEDPASSVSLWPDGQGGVLYSFGGPVRHLDARRSTTVIGSEQGIASGTVSSVFSDADGSLWVTGDRGVSQIVTRRFTNLARRDGLLEDEVSAILELMPGTFLFGHNRGLSVRLPTGSTRVRPFPRSGVSPYSTRVMDLVREPDGTVWAATLDAGAYRWSGRDGDPGRWLDRDDGLARSLSCLVSGPDGTLWLAGDGLYRRIGATAADGDRFERVDLAPLPADAYVRRMIVRRDGSLVLTTIEHGLLVIHGVRRRHVASGGLALYALLEDRHDRVWVGTGAGLARLGETGLEDVDEVAGTPVFLLLEDRDGRIWIGTDEGVSIWDGGTVRSFGVRQGLAGQETNRGAGLLDHEGGVWIGTNRGVSRYRRSLDHQVAPPRLVFEETLSAPAEPDSPIFRLRAISLADPSRIEISTRLEGFEDGWLDPVRSTRRQVRYTNLEPGRYRLHARARNENGPWSAAAASPWIEIEAPISSTWWFRALAGLGVIALGLAIQRGVVQRAYARRLEQEVRLRTRELERAIEETEAAIQARSRFLATVSHEIRTPLNAVLGLTGLVLESDLSSDQRERLEIVRQSGEGLLGLLNDILDYSKIEAETPALEERPFRLRGLVDGVVELYRPQIEARPVELRYRIDPAVPEGILADPSRLRQILVNLVGNAVKFTDEGEIVVEVTVRQGGEPPLELEFQVRDTGIGLSAEQQRRLFQPFVQADATVARRYGGTGLGLAISRRLVEAMGGRIEVESAPAQGSTFRFTLPTRGVDLPDPIPEAPAFDPELAQRLPLDILVADDNPVNQKIIVALLSRYGYRPDVAANGREVLAALAVRIYDLVLMDVRMPEMDGLEATLEIRRRWGHGLRIVALTAQALEGDRERCLAVGMDDYLSKPVVTAELVGVLERAAEARRATGEVL